MSQNNPGPPFVAPIAIPDGRKKRRRTSSVELKRQLSQEINLSPFGRFDLETQEQKKLRERREQEEKRSSWFITVNTHVSRRKLRTAQERKAVKDRLAEIVQQAFEEKPEDIIIQRGKPVDPSSISAENRIKIEFQKNHRGHQLHSHNLYVVKHRTKLHLDYGIIRDRITAAIQNDPLFISLLPTSKVTQSGYALPNVHFELGTRNGEKEIDYMEKGTHTIWTKQEVSDYFRNLRETNNTDVNAWNRFERVPVNENESDDEDGYGGGDDDPINNNNNNNQRKRRVKIRPRKPHRGEYSSDEDYGE